MTEKPHFPEIYFEEMTSTDLAEAGDAVYDWIAVLPVAATEQHGPHLPLGTDSFINNGLIKRFAESKAEEHPVTFLPVQRIGKSDEHSSFPGTLTLNGETARASWLQTLQSLATNGIRRMLILNSHGGNSALIDEICLEMRHLNVLCVGSSWSRLMDDNGKSASIVGADEKAFGIHGGDIETSLMLALHPELVRMEEAENFHSEQQELAEENKLLRAYGRHQFGWRMEDLNRYGVVGNAAAATKEKGEDLTALAMDGLDQLLTEIANFDLERFV